jgi:histidyl-tRNA synthetase
MKPLQKKPAVVVPRVPKKTDPPARLKGMKEILSEEWRYWRLVIDKALQLSRIYDFERIETPLIEAAALYEKTHGKNSELVLKELYSFVDKGAERVALRPQIKSSLVRAVIEHALIDENKLMLKTCQLGPVFRFGKLQNNYYRQHTQWSLDVIGEVGPIADVQLIQIGCNFFKELQLDTQVEINSIGDAECQAQYTSKLLEYYRDRTKKMKLPIEFKKQLLKNPLEALLSDDERLIEINEEAPQIIDFLSEEAKNDFFTVVEYLDVLGLNYSLNPKLFGHFDYYNRTVFEFVMPSEEGRKQLTLATGGRYGELFERLYGKVLPAVGLTVGLDRTVNRVRGLNVSLEDHSSSDIYLAQLGDTARQKAMILFEELRKAGFKISQGFLHNGLKRQLEEAQKLNVRFTLVLGQKELMDGTIIIRDMESGAQEVVDNKKIIHELEKRLKV